MYILYLLEIIEEILNRSISYEDVFCGFHDEQSLFANYPSSLCAFIIYKEWLLCSLKQKTQQPICNLSYFRNEIWFRLDIYSRQA